MKIPTRSATIAALGALIRDYERRVSEEKDRDVRRTFAADLEDFRALRVLYRRKMTSALEALLDELDTAAREPLPEGVFLAAGYPPHGNVYTRAIAGGQS